MKKKFADGGMPIQAQGFPVRAVPPRRPMPVQAQGVPVRGGLPAVRSRMVRPDMPVQAQGVPVRSAMKKGGAVKKMKCGGKTKMASGGSVGGKGDGCASKGKTKGRMC